MPRDSAYSVNSSRMTVSRDGVSASTIWCMRRLAARGPLTISPSFSSAGPRRHYVVVGRDDLPAALPPAPAHPRVGKPVAALERAARAMPADHEPPRDHRRRAEPMPAHVLV